MIWTVLKWALLVGPIFPFCYYLLAIYSARRFFRAAPPRNTDSTPPVSILKPVRGLDPDAYENFASFCRLDYPEYEILFCVADDSDAAIPVIEKLKQDFPQRSIRLLIGAEAIGANAKVNKLSRLAREARHELLVMSDSDIVVAPDYLRAVVAPFGDAQMGAVTCMYLGIPAQQIWPELEALGATSDFFAAVIVARQLRGVDFGLGATIATTKKHLAEIGGFESFADYLADDYELGHRIAMRGHSVELISHTVHTHYPAMNFSEYFAHQLRWSLALRASAPWGYVGMIFTQGLPWAIAAAATTWCDEGFPFGALLAAAYLGSYFMVRVALAWEVGVSGFRDPLVRRNWWRTPQRDLLWFVVWLVGLFKRRLIWRGSRFVLRRGRLVPLHPTS
ncbi:MAG: bacteriohopanetetrol glucosamine biosynthesis glycosyltransferase HpnI [Acidobacteria bacterium]|nr:bacteriohopanetetrol glucosamine biosynthesis glycosyltransferase HpnI [Acidobacteriota bacterium]MCL5287141.1 bacteriohopanetetrol glucosamine biosynthesis glycosyltransferase HpnI [Acidobacteriota bacterium]